MMCMVGSRFYFISSIFIRILKTMEGSSFINSFMLRENDQVVPHQCLTNFTCCYNLLIAYFGTPPEGTTKSCWIFCAYYTLPLEIRFDSKTSKPLRSNMKGSLISVRNYAIASLFNSLFFSFLCHFEYKPFGITKAGRFDEKVALLDYFDPRFLGNCFFHGRECNLVWY